jgi:hypothetical protein
LPVKGSSRARTAAKNPANQPEKGESNLVENIAEMGVALKRQQEKPGVELRKDVYPVSGTDWAALAKALLEKKASIRFQAKGGSMSPFIKDGDLLTLSPLSAKIPGLGHVVALIHPLNGKLLVHRAIMKRGDSLAIKGDNLPAMDCWVRRADLLGVVTRVERNGKNPLSGIGPGRTLIARLSRRGSIYPQLAPLWKVLAPFLKRWTS